MIKAVATSALALAAAVGVATVADGQSAGAPESGTFTYEVETTFSARPSPTSNPGVNPALPRDPDRMNRGDMWGLNAKIFVEGKAAGRSHVVAIWTRHGKGRQERGAANIIHVVEDFGNGDTLVLDGVQVNSPRDIPLAVVGGTGNYAGADGTAVIEEISFRGRTLRERVTVTFTP